MVLALHYPPFSIVPSPFGFNQYALYNSNPENPKSINQNSSYAKFNLKTFPILKLYNYTSSPTML